MHARAWTVLAFLVALSGSAAANDWATLDRDIEALAGTPPPQGGGIEIAGLLKPFYGFARDTSGTIDMLNDDLSGFGLGNAQVEASGSIEDYGFFVRYEAAGGGVTLLDGYGTWDVNEYVRYTMGQFRAPVLFASLVDDQNRLFILSRTDAGQLFYNRDTGAMLDGRYERIDWAVSTQNGDDDLGDEMRYGGRVGVDILGQGVDLVEGAYGHGDTTDLSFHVAAFEDTGLDDGTLFATDAQLRVGPFFASAQWLDFGDDPDPFIDPMLGPIPVRADSNPWALVASFMVVPDKYEVALRYESIDNINDDAGITASLTRYIQGHNLKWQIEYSSADSDVGERDFDLFFVGLTIRV